MKKCFYAEYVQDASIRIVATERSLHFLDLKGFKSDLEILRDCDEWQQWNERGDPVLHIEVLCIQYVIMRAKLVTKVG